MTTPYLPLPTRRVLDCAYLRWLRFWAALIVLFLFQPVAIAQPVEAGVINHLQGIATIQSTNGKLRFLEANDPVFVGDIISTTDKGYALITLEDNTQFVMRPSSSFALDKLVSVPGEEALHMRLLQGGARMVTGGIPKRNPSAFQLVAKAAQVGVNGTAFDTRICADDCRREGVTPVVPVGGSGISDGTSLVARVVQVTGQAQASRPGWPARNLRVGSALHEGDEIKTAAHSTAVIGFLDRSKVSINPESMVRLSEFRHTPAVAATNKMTLDLAKGGVRALTGLLGKQSPEQFSVKTRTATVGIRGTGMDISCQGPCSDEPALDTVTQPSGTTPPDQLDGLFVQTWEGGTYFSIGPFDIPLGRTGFIGRSGQPVLLDRNPAFFERFLAPRPDQVEVDWEQLFNSVASTGSPGVYVFAREGDVFVMANGQRIDLAPGEAGYVKPNGSVERIAPIPGFLVTDPYPSPEKFNGQDAFILQLYGVTMGQPGQDVCRF